MEEKFFNENKKLYELYIGLKTCSVIIFLFIGLIIYSIFTFNLSNIVMRMLVIVISILAIILLKLRKNEFWYQFYNLCTMISLFKNSNFIIVSPRFSSYTEESGALLDIIAENQKVVFFASFHDMKIYVSMKKDDCSVRQDIFVYDDVYEFLENFKTCD